MIVSAGGRGGKPGTVRQTRKEQEDPPSWLPLIALAIALLLASPAVVSASAASLLKGWVPGETGAPSAIWVAPEAGSRANTVSRVTQGIKGL